MANLCVSGGEATFILFLNEFENLDVSIVLVSQDTIEWYILLHNS